MQMLLNTLNTLLIETEIAKLFEESIRSMTQRSRWFLKQGELVRR